MVQAEILIAEKKTVFLPVWTAETDGTGLVAAAELVRFLSEITGTDYPLLTGGRAPARCITVALSSDRGLGTEGFTIKAAAGNVRIEGGAPRGLLYGVYDFLERLGCRWWSATASHIPKRSRLTFPVMDITELPQLEYRDINGAGSTDPYFALRNKYNGQCSEITPELGGKMSSPEIGCQNFMQSYDACFLASHS
jgi:alpha-glucuronidase